MPARRPARALLVGLATLAVASGCVAAKEDADRGNILDALVDNGVPAAEAECVADGIMERFGEDQGTLNDIRDAQDPADLTPEVNAALEDLTADCGTG